MVVLLAVAPNEGLARQAVGDRIGDEGVRFQQAVADGFAAVAASEPERFVTIDTMLRSTRSSTTAYREMRDRW